MNCPQCQMMNGPDAAFCGNCGTRLAAAGAPSGAAAYPPASGYDPAGAPTAYNAPGGQGQAAPGYSAPGGYSEMPPPYHPAGGQAPGGYSQGQYQQGQYPQGQYSQGQYQPGTAGPFMQRSGSSGLPPVNFDLTRLNTVDKVVAGATLVTMISLWMPWFSATYLGRSSGSISGTGDHGWLWLEFILALALLAYLAARAAWAQLPFNLPVSHERLLIGATALQFLLILIGFFAMPSTDGIQGISVSWDFGAFLGLIGSIVAAGPVIYPFAKTYTGSRKTSGSRTH